VQDNTIVRNDRMGMPVSVYPGAIYVRRVGADLHTGDQRITVAWSNAGEVMAELTIPRAVLTDGHEFGKLLGGAGAALHPNNIRAVAQLLVEFIVQNRSAIPEVLLADRLGLARDGLVLPAGTVGLDESARYVGNLVATGADPDAYPAALRQVMGWDGNATTLLLLGLSLASPVIGRTRPPRNPVVYLAGPSDIGKTTAVQFALGVWGEPSRLPFQVQAPGTTKIGLQQSLTTLGGLPLFLDECHQVAEPRMLESYAYLFANGEMRVVGTPTGRARGGESLAGTLFMVGEATLEQRGPGAGNRTLTIDGSRFPPLGAGTIGPGSAAAREGQRRATLLADATTRGCGLFGLAVMRAVWEQWDEVLTMIGRIAAEPALAGLRAWAAPLATATAVLNIACKVADAEPPPLHLVEEWVHMLRTGREDRDIAGEVFEKIKLMLAQAELDAKMDDTTSWPMLKLNHEPIAYRRPGDTYWRVPPSTPQFEARVGKNAVQLYGQTWLARSYILPGNDGQAASKDRIPKVGTMRVLRVPLPSGDEEEV
jgi:hypothetical protein